MHTQQRQQLKKHILALGLLPHHTHPLGTRTIEALVETVQKEWVELLKTYAEIDENGKFKPAEIRTKVKDKDGNIVEELKKEEGTFRISPEKQEDFMAAQNLFRTKEAVIEASPILFSTVVDVGLSAAELLQLEGIVVEDPTTLKAVTAK